MFQRGSHTPFESVKYASLRHSPVSRPSAMAYFDPRRGDGRYSFSNRSFTSAAHCAPYDVAPYIAPLYGASPRDGRRASRTSFSSFTSTGSKYKSFPVLYGGFDYRVRSKVCSCLRAIEKRLSDLGRPADLLSGVVGDELPSAEDMELAITRTVNGLKAECRVDERLYEICGELIHARIMLHEVPFESWLTSKELGLRDDVFQDIKAERDLVEMTVMRFYEEQFHVLKNLGLQSALKYDEVYLARLENGKKESMGQFFARLAAAAATECMATPQFAAALTSGYPSWRSSFGAMFWSLARHSFVPATPCMMSTGRKDKATASCYLLDPRCDTIDSSVTAIVEEVAPLLRARGGIGISLQRVNGKAGVMPAMKLLDSLVAASNVECTRSTGVCVYLEPWHADVMSALSMRGMLAPEESRRCDNLFLGLWMCDLVFKRYERHLAGEESVMWTLFDDTAGHLASLYGEDFEREYERLEAAGLGVASMPVKDFMYAVVKSAVFTGSPFVTFKDQFNRHFHLDTSRDALACTNLCTEIAHKTGPGESGVCNLASVNLARFVIPPCGLGRARFDFDGLRHAARVATVFANAASATGEKPTESTARGSARHRSIGIGVQGFHTAVLEMGLCLEDPETRDLNTRIFETLLLEVMSVSCEFCEHGLEPFHDFYESAYARGWMHFDGWPGVRLAYQDEWDALRGRVSVSGLYNSQFVALMPTAASAQVTEVSEGFSPAFSNLFSKVTSTGELLKPNGQLMRDLRAVYGNNESARLEAIAALDAAGWSVEAALGNRRECASLAKYKTAFEYNQKVLIDLCKDRAPFVDQSQSMTLFVTEKADGTLPASRVMDLLMYGYRAGLKTGMYYCKIQKATNNGVFAGSGDIVCSACVV